MSSPAREGTDPGVSVEISGVELGKPVVAVLICCMGVDV
jgi:hypothetical protein